MTYNFYFASLIFLAGFSFFSVLYHFTAEQPRKQRLVHQLFAGITLSLIGTIITGVITSNTLNLADHMKWVRINIAFNVVMYGLLPWFFALYSGVRPKLLLIASSALCMLLFVINLTQPNTLLYSEIHGIDRLILPWGEAVFLIKSTSSIWGIISFCYVLFVPIFGLYAIIMRYQLDRRRSTLIMIFAVAVLLITLAQNLLVRVAGFHNLPPLGAFGFLSMVIIMGIVLTRELQEGRKLAEVALRESECKARAIINQSLQFIGLVSPDGILLDANRAALELVGVTPQDVYNKPFWESPWWNHSAELQNKLRESIKLAAAGEDIRFETNHQTSDGSLRYVDFSLRPVKNEQGDILYIIPEGHDITERKLAQENLMESQRKLATLMGNLPGLAFRCKNDMDWSMMFLSKGCFELTGFYPQEFEDNLQNSYGKLIHKDDKDMVWQKVQESLKKHTFWAVEYRIHTKEELEKWVWEQGCGIYSNTGELEALEGFITDITDRKRAEEVLIKSEARLSALLSSMKDVIFEIDLNGRFENYYAQDNKGLYVSPDFFIRKKFDEVLPPNVAKLLSEAIEDIHKGESSRQFDYSLTIENNIQYESAIVTPRYNSSNEIIGNTIVCRDITERKFAERALSSLATNFAGLSGKAFFEAVSKHIATEMGIDYVYVGELTDSKDAVRVLGGFALGEAMSEMLYDLSETPCSDVMKNDTCLYTKGIQQQYPEDILLQQMGIDSYLGSRIYNKDQEAIGLLVALHSKPLNNPDILSNLFSIFLDRIAAELHRLHAYEALHKNEVIQRKMISNIGDVIVIIDKNGINQYKSLNVEKWFGWKPEDLVGKSTWDNVHPDDLLIGQEFLGLIMSEPNASGTIELRYRKKDNSYCWIEISIVNLLNDPDICGLLGNYHDISDRKKNEANLIKLYAAINSSKASIVITDINGNIEFANPYFTELTNYSEDEYLGKNPKVLKSGIHNDEYYKALWETLTSGNTWEGEFCNRKKNGELYWEKSIITPIKNEKEEIVNFVAVKSDITTEKKHEYLDEITLEIYEKSEYLSVEEVLKLSIELGIQLTDSEIGFFHFVNDDQETISLQAWSAKTMDICNIPTLDKHYPISKAGIWVECFYQKRPIIHNDYYSLSHKKGLPEGHATLIRDLSVPVIIENQVVAILGVGNKENDYNNIDAEFLSIFAENVWNVIRRKKSESDTILAKEKAEESDRLKSAFIANMSHEIRTPMNGILGFSELLSEPGLESEIQLEYIRIIQKSGARMLNIISEIMDISKIESGLTEISKKEVNIPKLLESVYELLKPDADVKTLNFSIKQSWPIEANIFVTDEEKLFAILSNLVKNAIKYTDKGSIEIGYISTNTTINFNELQFYVKDTGIGIPKDRQQAIFERFIQADIADIQARQGAGLGLSIAKAYVEMLDGKIWVESEEEKGSCFYFTIANHVEPEEKLFDGYSNA